MAKVSILMNGYNSAEFLRETLQSVFNQSFKDWEIIFIDNCSTDNTSEIIKEYSDKIKYYKTEKNIPLYAAREFGMAYVKGEFLCVLDTDDLWEKDKLKNQIEVAEKFKADFIFTNFLNFYTGPEKLKKFKYDFYSKRQNIRRSLIQSGFKEPLELIKSYYINLQSIMIRTSALKGQNFNPTYNLAGDFEFFLRLFKFNSIKPYFLSQTLTKSRMHSKQLSKKLSSDWEIEVQHIYEHSLKDKLNESERKWFRFHVDYFKMLRLRDEGKSAEARKLLSHYKNLSMQNGLLYLRSFFW
ncbi:MAG: glycosyltransferase family 2 protein [Bacteriovoracaceae bacterium]